MGAVFLSSCKQRNSGTNLLEDEATADEQVILTSNRKRVYPSDPMLAAAQTALNNSIAAKRNRLRSEFFKQMRIVKLQLRMRPYKPHRHAELPNSNESSSLADAVVTDALDWQDCEVFGCDGDWATGMFSETMPTGTGSVQKGPAGAPFLSCVVRLRTHSNRKKICYQDMTHGKTESEKHGRAS